MYSQPIIDIDALAHLIGTHAVLLLLCGTAVLLLITAVGWHLVNRYGEASWQLVLSTTRSQMNFVVGLLPPEQASAAERALDLMRKNYFGIHALVGFTATLTLLLTFTELTEALNADDALARFDFALASTLHEVIQPQTYTFFAYVTHLGDRLSLTTLGVVVAVILVVRKQWLLLYGWLLALIGNSLLNFSLKTFFQRLRPLHDHGFSAADGWSFPSGHSSGALVTYGMLAYLALRHSDRPFHLPIVLLAITVIQLVGGSRVILQVHYLTDVIAGFCSGSAWLAICIAGIEIALRHRRPGAPSSM
jgi:membrane-associated phospholipid phosphatase